MSVVKFYCALWILGLGLIGCGRVDKSDAVGYSDLASNVSVLSTVSEAAGSYYEGVRIAVVYRGPMTNIDAHWADSRHSDWAIQEGRTALLENAESPDQIAAHTQSSNDRCVRILDEAIVGRLNIPSIVSYPETIKEFHEEGVGTIEYERDGLMPYEQTMPFIAVYSLGDCTIKGIFAVNALSSIRFRLDIDESKWQGGDTARDFDPVIPTYYFRSSTTYGVDNYAGEPAFWVGKPMQSITMRLKFLVSRNKVIEFALGMSDGNSLSGPDVLGANNILRGVFSGSGEFPVKEICLEDYPRVPTYRAEALLSDVDSREISYLDFKRVVSNYSDPLNSCSDQ